MKIAYNRFDETLRYAAEELKKYLLLMTPDWDVDMEYTHTLARAASDAIKLGLLSDFQLDTSDVADIMTDDVVDIDIQNGAGRIAGSNIRSILLGVYTYLKSAGCMWVRPGQDGEFIPKKDMRTHSYTYRKKADNPFRGECIEGSISFEHVWDTITWMPKVGMNLFMMEQVIPYNYISRWYEHQKSTVEENENVPFETVGEMVIALEKHIKKCGLQLHALGHGYLLEPYGIHYKDWKSHYELTDEAREDVALVKGKRELFHGSPNFTHLCYSKDKARLGLVKFLVDYLGKKPYIDFLHVWLSDAANNQCECENCTKKRVSDWYVIMLNELDAELTKRGIETKIVFIMYIDTLWAPLEEKLHNPSRFIMTTATHRNYSFPYSAERDSEPLPEYKRNEYALKSSFPLTLSFMDEWQPAFEGPKFFFEYYMYTAHFIDMGHFQMSRLMNEDAKRLHSLGIDGIMSDQTQRSYLPTALPNAIFGETLTDTTLDFETYARKYFAAAYGADGDQVYTYLNTITELFDPNQLRSTVSVVQQDTGTGGGVTNDEIWRGNPDTIARLAKIEGYVNSFIPVIDAHLAEENRCHAKSWRLLRFHADLCIRTAAIYLAIAELDKAEAKKLLADTMDWISKNERTIAPEFDMVLYEQYVSGAIRV